MRFLELSALSALASAVAAAPLSGSLPGRFVVHEKRNIIPSSYLQGARADKDLVVPVRIGLTQSNLHHGYDKLMDVSDPDSPNFGKHWTQDEIVDFFAPARSSVDAVLQWLKSAGIQGAKHSNNQGWIEFDATAEEVEELLQAEYHLYDNQRDGRPHLACKEYSVPEHIREHIDIITPTVHFDGTPGGPKYESFQRREQEKRGLVGRPTKGKKVAISSIANSVANCGTQITPTCLRALYKMPVGSQNLSTFGIVEYAPETYLQSDLNNFWSSPSLNDANVPAGTKPKIVKIDGGYLEPSSDQSFGINGEPDLDLEYAMDLVYPQTVKLLQTGDNGENADMISFNNFLDAIDKSYCTYDGGDDPTIDESFPDPGGYSKPEQCGAYQAPAVISTSYSYNEHDLTPFYEARQCHEYMKLGLAGVSFFFSSGDYGVAGNQGECINPDGSYNNGTSGRFNPSFPGVCPYVTSVGATQIPSGGSVTTPETACETVIYSGGGFSDNFAIPSYQSAAVKSWFTNHPTTYTSAQFNNSQKARAIPDVSANGANYITAIDGEFYYVYGTSASSPTFASLITLINNKRVAAGKKSLGFLNPTFYKNPTAFNDITSGGNQGCGTPGFTAVTGWDPVTGLGTPNFVKLSKILVALP